MVSITRHLPLALPILTVGCTNEPKVLEPRTPPPAVVPPVELPRGQPPEGLGRVVLGTTDGPMKITAAGDTAFVPQGGGTGSKSGVLCAATPCVVDLPYGRYSLFYESTDGSYGRGDADEVVVKRGTTVHLRAPGKYVPRSWKQPGPIALLFAGSIMMGLGAATAAKERDPHTGQQELKLTGTSTALMLGGLGMFIVGAVLEYDFNRGARQDGASTVWMLSQQ